jgi:hypothetical protein
MGSLEDMLRDMDAQHSSRKSALDAAFARFHQQLSDSYTRQFLGGIKGAGDPAQQLGALNNALGSIPKPKPVDPGTRIKEIDEELDIIRGVRPTPKGYKIDPRRVKVLMIERAKLQKLLTG